MKKIIFVIIFGLLLGSAVGTQTFRGTPSQLRVNVDANGYLVTAAGIQTNPVTQVQFSNARLAVDSSGNLLTVISGGSGVGTVTSIATTSPITGGTITSTGTIACATCTTQATSGADTDIPFYNSSGALTNNAGLSFNTTNGNLLITGQTSSPTSGVIRTTLNYPGDGNIRAVYIAKRDSEIGGTATAGDGVEFLAQSMDTAGAYSNIGGFIARTLDATPNIMTGRLEFAVKPSGNPASTFDITQMVINHNGNVGLGYYFGNSTLAAAPASILHVARDGTDPAGAGTVITAERASGDTSSAALSFRKARGSLTSYSAVQTNDDLMSMTFRGYQTTTNGYVTSSSITATAEDNFTSTVFGSRINFNVTPIGSGSITNVGRITQSGFTSAGSTPSVANVGTNSCGTTAATIAGNPNSGEVTVGATAGTQCRVTVPAAPVRWNGNCSNTTTGNLCRFVGVSTTTFDLVGTFVAGDVIDYVALPR